MISYQHVLEEIERQVQLARQTNNEASMREALAAIRSLSEVALSGGGRQQENVAPRNLVTQHVAPQAISTPQVQSLNSLESKPIEEEDGANGKSIFDF